MKKKQNWILPLVFLLGYVCAWSTILVDRQMLIAEQEALSQELERTRQELKLRETMEDFEHSWQEMVIWNEEALEPLKEEEGK